MMQLGITTHARYRTVDEARILQLLLHFGWAYEVRAGDVAAALRAAAEALSRWVSLGLPYEQLPDGQRRFDPAEVMNFGKWVGIQGRDSCWEERFVTNARRLIFEFHSARDKMQSTPPPPTALLRPEGFSVTLRREFDLRDHQPGAKLRLRLPLPLEDEALRALSVTAISPPDFAVDFTVAPGRLDARLRVPPTQVVTLAARVSFTAYPTAPGRQTAQLSDAEFELYTRPREGLIGISPRIQTLAAKLADSAQGSWATVQRFWDFIHERLIWGIMHYDELDVHYPADQVLDAGWFDCQLGSALLAALCRARRIPARLVSGYLLYSVSATYHYWAEVWVEGRGWMPLDLFCADLSARGRNKLWRDYFLGNLDYRMKTQCLPRLFDSAAAIRFPARWYMLPRLDAEGTETGFFANDTGALIFRDRITVYRGVAEPAEHAPMTTAKPL
jgi:hypothetical protein